MHCLQAFIVKEEHLAPYVRRVPLPQGFVLVPADEYLVAQFPQLTDNGTRGFSHFLCDDKPAIAVFTDYFGGAGEQSAEHSDGTYLDRHFAIDEMLAKLGVVKEKGLDEFDTIGLGSYRSTWDVLGKPRDFSSISAEEAKALSEIIKADYTQLQVSKDHIKFGDVIINEYGNVSTVNQANMERMEDLIMTITKKIEDPARETEFSRIDADRKRKDELNRKVQIFLAEKNFLLTPSQQAAEQ